MKVCTWFVTKDRRCGCPALLELKAGGLDTLRLCSEHKAFGGGYKPILGADIYHRLKAELVNQLTMDEVKALTEYLEGTEVMPALKKLRPGSSMTFKDHLGRVFKLTGK